MIDTATPHKHYGINACYPIGYLEPNIFVQLSRNFKITTPLTLISLNQISEAIVARSQHSYSRRVTQTITNYRIEKAQKEKQTNAT